jgi:hypothetical protein
MRHTDDAGSIFPCKSSVFGEPDLTTENRGVPGSIPGLAIVGVLGILADAGDVVLTVRFRVSPPPELAAIRSFFAFCQGCAGGVFGPGNGEIGVYRTN